jgi:hypothetical protein
MRRTFALLALSLVALFPASSSALARSGAATDAGARKAAATGKLDAALDSIRLENIKADIFFIASDELEGRDTPSPGQRIAARFLRARLERLGFAPGAENGYIYEYPLYLPRLDETKSYARSSLRNSVSEFTLGVDYYVQSRSLAAFEGNGAVVYCGSGREKDVPKDLAKAVGGKWALCFDDGKTFSDVLKNLTEAGALGVLMAPGPGYDDKPYSERFGDELRRLRAADVSWPREDKRDGVLPVVWLAPSAAERLAPELFGENAKRNPKPGTELAASFAHARVLAGDNGMVQCENVCGLWPGSDPALRDEVIVLSAHYDHVGWRGQKREIHNGADDNGSGTTTLLAVAEALAAHGPMRRSVLLMWVSGEEKGLFGSKAWTEKPWLPGKGRAVCNLNIDMVGRNAPEKLMITPTAKRAEYNGLVKLAEDLAPLEGFPKLESCDTYWDRSDHANFARNLKIPVAFLFSDVHQDYHKPTDDPDKIDFDKVRRVSRLVVRMLNGLQEDKLKL